MQRVASYFATELEHSGYGYIGINLKHQLQARGLTFLDIDAFGWDALLAFTPPRAGLLGTEPRPDIILHTMFEADPMPERWVEICNRVGLVWVPSQWCKDLFRRCGVTTPIIVAGYGYNPQRLAYLDRSGRTGPIKVLVWGDALVTRKNVLGAMKAYIGAELPGAILSVKVASPSAPTVTHEGLPRTDIEIISGPMQNRELLDWLHSGDVLLYVSGGEGYGLQPLEAMATGLPVVAMRVTGLTEYLQDGAYFDVPHLGLGLSPSLEAIYHSGVKVFVPDLGAAAQQLQYVADHREEAYEVGTHGYETIKELTWDRAGVHAYRELQTWYRSKSC